MKKHLFLKILSIIVLIVNCNISIFYADELRMGVAPSFINNLELKDGETTTINLLVANTSIFANNKNLQNIKNNTFKVHLELSDKSDLGIFKDNVKFLKNDFFLKPNERLEVPIKITLPHNAHKVEYPLYIDILQKNSLNGTSNKESISANTSFLSIIEVPIFINNKNAKGKTSYILHSFDLFDDTKTTSLLNLFKRIITLDKTVFEEILYKPIKIKINDFIIYDLPKNKNTKLKNVITYNKYELSNSKYIYLPKQLEKWTSTFIDKISFKENNFEIILFINGESYSFKIPNKTLFDNIKIQLTKLSQNIGNKPTIEWILNNINVPKNILNTNVNLYSTYTIENNGDKTITPFGKLQIANKNNNIIDTKDYSLTLIKPNETKRVISTIPYDSEKLTQGKYTVTSVFKIIDNGKLEMKENSFYVLNIRILIIVSVIIFSILLLILIIYLIKQFRKAYKYKKKEK